MFSRTILAAFALLVVLAISSCSGSSSPVSVDPTDSPRLSQWHFGNETIVPLIAGQNYTAGELTVTNDYNNFYFEIVLIDDWMMSESHLHVADSYEGLPQTKKGNPKPGQFDYPMYFDPAVNAWTYTVPLGDFMEGDTIAFAFHAVVTSDLYGEETGWAGCYDFTGKRWATWCEHIVSECVIDLPGCLVDYTAKYYYPGSMGYWDVEFFNIPTGFDVYDGTWPAWCIQRFTYAYPNVEYDICLISAYDAELPPGADGVDWEGIAWILNHKHPDAGILQIQQAIWYFTPEGYPVSGYAADMVNDALANKDGYDPGEGELMPVIVYHGDTTQLIFVEVEIDCE